jgi:hypothetical protein
MEFLGGHENFRMMIIVQLSKGGCNKAGIFGARERVKYWEGSGFTDEDVTFCLL